MPSMRGVSAFAALVVVTGCSGCSSGSSTGNGGGQPVNPAASQTGGGSGGGPGGGSGGGDPGTGGGGGDPGGGGPGGDSGGGGTNPGADGGTGGGHGIPAFGAHVLLTHDETKGTNPAVTKAVATQAAGSTLLAVSMGWISNYATPSDAMKNTWTSLGGMHPYATANSVTNFYTAVWSATGARGGTTETLTAAKPGNPTGEISLELIEIKNGGVVKPPVYAYPNADQVTTPGSVTTTGPATLIAIWSGDSWDLNHTAVPDNGFTVFDSYLNLGATSGVQNAFAYKQVAAAGTYSVTWTATPKQGAACYLIAIEQAR